MIHKDSFTFVVVHPQKTPDFTKSSVINKEQTCDDHFLYYKRQYIKYYGPNDPYSTVTKDITQTVDQNVGSWCRPVKKKMPKLDVDFYGIVTFELGHQEIGGMEYSNMLIENSSRVVFEAKTATKRSFANVESFFNYYNMPTSLQHNDGYYTPALDSKK